MPRLSALSSRSLSNIGVGILDPIYLFTSYEQTTPANEVGGGGSKTFIVSTQFVPINTTLYWTINHISSSPEDFQADSGSFQIYSNGNYSINVQLVQDQLTEGTEQYSVQLRTGSTSGPIVATSWIVDIEDTSLTVYTGGQLPAGYRLASIASPPAVSGVITDAEVFVASSITDQGPGQFAYYYSSDLTNWTQYSDGFQSINYRADINTLAFYNGDTEDPEYGQLYLVFLAGGGDATLAEWNGSFFSPISGLSADPTPARIYIGYRNGPAFLLLTTSLTGVIKNSGGYTNWTEINSAGVTASNIQANIAWGYNTDIIVAANYDDPSGVRIVRSTDLGYSWTAVVDNTDWTAPGTEYAKGVAYGQGEYYALCANGADLISTSNDGVNWTTPAAVPGLRAGADNIWTIRTGSGFSAFESALITYTGANDTYVSILSYGPFDPFAPPGPPTLVAYEVGPFNSSITEIFSNGRQVFGSTPGGTIHVLDLDQQVLGPVPASVEFTILDGDWDYVAGVSNPVMFFSSAAPTSNTLRILEDIEAFLLTPVATMEVYVNGNLVSTETITFFGGDPANGFLNIETADGWPSPFSGNSQPAGTVIRFVQIS